MKIGVFTALFQDQPIQEVLESVAAAGVDAVELAAGGYPGDQIGRSELLKNPAKIRELRGAVAQAGLSIAALSCHGNPLHPQESVRTGFDIAFQETVRLAHELEVPTVVTFSGCPGDSDHAQYPNWVTCTWPPDYSTVLEWQWTEKVIPYWSRQVPVLEQLQVRVAIEMHPGFVVYNPETLLRLRAATGEVIGANLDPSHFFWQGIDPVAAIRALGSAIYHVHAKDTRIDAYNTAVNGVLDTKSYRHIQERSWIFRTVGYGHGAEVWGNIISALRVAGYNGVLSIEHEDALMSDREGFRKAVTFLKELVIREDPATPWWA